MNRGTQPAAPAAVMEVAPGGMSRTAADRLAALTVRGARAACAMIHLTDGANMRLIGGHALPAGFEPMQRVPMIFTLGGQVLRSGFPVVIGDVDTDDRVPAEAPVRAVGIHSYAGYPIHDSAGAIVGVCAVMDYLPRRWQPDELTAVDDGAQACAAFVAEQRAHQGERAQRLFLNTLLDSLDTGVAACDADGRMVVVNRSLRDRLGVGEVHGHAADWAGMLPVTTPAGEPVAAREGPLLRALHDGDVRDVEQVLHTRDGRRLMRVNAHPIADGPEHRIGAVEVFHDITEARRAEELQQMLSRAKDEYLNLVGHELRTPVTIIVSYLELLADAGPDTPAAELLPLIEAVCRGGERLRRLVEALLELSALDAGRAPVTMEDLDLVTVVASAVRAVGERAAGRGITVTLDGPERMPMRGDPRRLAQLAGALLDNAITYTPDGGTVGVTLAGAALAVTLEVADTGFGIPEHERPYVFDRFYRGAVTTELAIPGAGLGLAIAKLIAERHHGTVTIRPRGARPGTNVHVELPRDQPGQKV